MAPTRQSPHAFDLVCLGSLDSPARYDGKHLEVCLGVSRFQGYSWFVRRWPVINLFTMCGLQAGRCRSKKTPPPSHTHTHPTPLFLCSGEIKPEGFVLLTVCLSGALHRVTKHVVTAGLMVSAGRMDGCFNLLLKRRIEDREERGAIRRGESEGNDALGLVGAFHLQKSEANTMW